MNVPVVEDIHFLLIQSARMKPEYFKPQKWFYRFHKNLYKTATRGQQMQEVNIELEI